MRVPHDIHSVARSVWVRGNATADEHNVLTRWASQRWPTFQIPVDSETLSLWIVSIAIQDGVSFDVDPAVFASSTDRDH